jgi:hypothetical protein
MSAVVDFEAWRRRRQETGEIEAPGSDRPSNDDPGIARLELAVGRVHALVDQVLVARGRVTDRVETELLAIMGELAVGLVAEATDRAERLADQLARSS